MGDHYIPKYYLRGFCDPLTPDTISRYEKGDTNVITTGLNNVAQETGFYSKEIEDFLSIQIEGPANPVLDKIRERKQITTEEKFILSIYITTMLKRVPQSQALLRKSAPAIFESVFSKLDEELRSFLMANPSKSEIIEKRREEAKKIRGQLGDYIPKDIWLQTVLPHTALRLLAMLNAMNWRFLTQDDSAFLTNDNPVFYHPEIGIGKPNSEVTFPISRDIVLWATWKLDWQEGFYPASKRNVFEINHRTVRMATRYIFFSHEEQWVTNLVKRNKFMLRHAIK
jgi:hypothetical protein